jgi:hypothetical protein
VRTWTVEEARAGLPRPGQLLALIAPAIVPGSKAGEPA